MYRVRRKRATEKKASYNESGSHRFRRIRVYGEISAPLWKRNWM